MACPWVDLIRFDSVGLVVSVSQMSVNLTHFEFE